MKYSFGRVAALLCSHTPSSTPQEGWDCDAALWCEGRCGQDIS